MTSFEYAFKIAGKSYGTTIYSAQYILYSLTSAISYIFITILYKQVLQIKFF